MGGNLVDSGFLAAVMCAVESLLHTILQASRVVGFAYFVYFLLFISF